MTPVPRNELERLKALHEYQILDSLAESSYDDLTKLAALICQVPLSTISFVDSERTWFKSLLKLDFSEVPRSKSFASLTILENDCLIIPDMQADPRFRDHFQVIHHPHIQFYAGVPISVGNGLNIGAIGVADTKPNSLNESQVESLHAISRTIAGLLESRNISRLLQQSLKDQLASEKKLVHTAQITALAEMSGGIAHEINNPLGVMQIAVEYIRRLVKKKQIDDPDLMKVVETLKSSTERIAKIIRSLRSYSRDASNDRAVDSNIREIIEDTLLFCQEQAQVKNIEVRIEASSSKIHLKCHPSQISQVLLNLIHNSIDAVESLPEKWIQISVSEDPEQIHIELTDSGNGIPLELQDKIFKAFFTTKSSGKGTGLGLGICKRLIENHGGTLKLNSDQPHTSFSITLPKQFDATA